MDVNDAPVVYGNGGVVVEWRGMWWIALWPQLHPATIQRGGWSACERWRPLGVSGVVQSMHYRTHRIHQQVRKIMGSQGVQKNVCGVTLVHRNWRNMAVDWWCSVGRPVGNPKRKVWWAQHQVSLSMKPRFIEPVGERTNFRRLMLTGLVTPPDNLYVTPYLERLYTLPTRLSQPLLPRCSFCSSGRVKTNMRPFRNNSPHHQRDRTNLHPPTSSSHLRLGSYNLLNQDRAHMTCGYTRSY
jgi:hypothetical protein